MCMKHIEELHELQMANQRLKMILLESQIKAEKSQEDLFNMAKNEYSNSISKLKKVLETVEKDYQAMCKHV